VYDIVIIYLSAFWRRASATFQLMWLTRIKVDQGTSPLPTASTCFNQLHIDTTVLTKAKFLENLEHLVRTKGFGNT
jgi:hypothetical protein